MGSSDDAWRRTLARARQMPHAATLPPSRTVQPHAAKVFASARPPHAATVAQPRFGRVHPAVAFQRGIVQRSSDEAWGDFDDWKDFDSAPKAVAPKAGDVTCGSRIEVYSEREELLVPEVGAIAAWVVVGKAVFGLSNAHVVGTDLGLAKPDTGYPVDASGQLVGWTSIYNQISRLGGTWIDAGLFWFEPGTVLKAHPLVSMPPRNLDKEPLLEDEKLYMTPGLDEQRMGVKVVEAKYKEVRESITLEFTHETRVKMNGLYVLKSELPVSIPGESGGLWVDAKGRPTLHNNWGTNGKDGSGNYLGGGTKLIGTNSAFEWIQKVFGEDATLSFDDLVVEENPHKKLDLKHFDYLPVALRVLEKAYLGELKDLKDIRYVPEEHHGAMRKAYETYAQKIPHAKSPSAANALVTEARHAFVDARETARAEYEDAKKVKRQKALEQKSESQGGDSVAFSPPPKSGRTRTKMKLLPSDDK